MAPPTSFLQKTNVDQYFINKRLQSTTAVLLVQPPKRNKPNKYFISYNAAPGQGKSWSIHRPEGILRTDKILLIWRLFFYLDAFDAMGYIRILDRLRGDL
jgi:hypothetical protein